MNVHARSALAGSAAAIALVAVPSAALASQGDDDAGTESNSTVFVTMSGIPLGMHAMMNSPGHERFMASPGQPHVMSSLGHQATMD